MINQQQLQAMNQGMANLGNTRQQQGMGNMGMGMGMGNMGMMGNQGMANMNMGDMRQQGFSNPGMQQQLQRIHQNSIFQGNKEPDNAFAAMVSQRSIQGEEPNVLGFGMNNMGGQAMGMMNQGGGQGNNSLQNAINMAQGGQGTMMSGMGGQMGGMANMGNMNQGGQGTMMGGQGMMGMGMMGGGMTNMNMGDMRQQGFSNPGMQQQLQRIHQNSIFQGNKEPDNAFAAMVSQRSIQGEEPNPLTYGLNNMGGQAMGMMSMGGQGGGQNNQGNNAMQNMINMSQNGGQAAMMGGMANMGDLNQMGQGSMMGGQMGGMGGQMGGMANMGNQNQGGQGMGMNTGYQNQAMQQQLQRIHQNSIFGGGQQQSGGYGGGSTMMMGGQGGGFQGNAGNFRQVMNADAFSNRYDNQGPDSYPAAMYTGSNQYDNVNPGVLNQMVSFGRQF